MVSGVAARAFQAARILNVLAMVVLILGWGSGVLVFVGSLFSGESDAIAFGFVYAVVAFLVTAVYWAMIQVASVVASYVGVKVDG